MKLVKFLSLILLAVLLQTFFDYLGYALDLTGSLLLLWALQTEAKTYQLATLSLLSDFLGPWYLGTHLIALAISILLFERFLLPLYRSGNYLQKLLLAALGFFVYFSLLLLVAFTSHNLTLPRNIFLPLFLQFIIFVPLWLYSLEYA